MSFLIPRTNLNTTRAQKRKKQLAKLIFSVILCFLVCLALVIYFLCLRETKIAVILAVLGVLILANNVFFCYYLIKKLYKRYAQLCTDDNFAGVLIFTNLKKVNYFTRNNITMAFFRNEDQARNYAKLNDFLLQNAIPKALKKQKKDELSQLLEKRNISPFNYFPADLYDLRNKKILLTQRVAEYYGEPDKILLSQNNCTYVLLPKETGIEQ